MPIGPIHVVHLIDLHDYTNIPNTECSQYKIGIVLQSNDMRCKHKTKMEECSPKPVENNCQAYCENNCTNKMKSCSRQHRGTPHSTSEIQAMVILFDHHRGTLRGAYSGFTTVHA